MGSGSAVRLELGVEIEKQVLAKDGTREDISLVLEEAPDFAVSVALQLVERARMIRGDKDCFRIVNDEVVIEIPAKKRPTLDQLRKKHSWLAKIERDDSTEEPVTLRLATVLKSTESRISGEVYERRLAKLRADGKLLGYQHMQYLLEVQKKHPELMALLGKVYIDFPGLIVVFGDGDRNVPYVGRGGGRFVGGWDWLDYVFDGSGRVAVSSK